MQNLETKQKIIIGIIIFIMVGVIALYCYLNFQKTNEEILLEDEQTENTDSITENEAEENVELKNENEKMQEQEIVIHIAGAVKKEGIIKLKEGSRIADAIEKAEGLKENASTKNVNLAYVLEDGQKIYIPTKEEENEDKQISIISSGQENIIEETKKENTNKDININTADKEELKQISGIGDATAQKIIDYRNENGKFKTIEDIKNVSGIGDAKFNQIKDYIKI